MNTELDLAKCARCGSVTRASTARHLTVEALPSRRGEPQGKYELGPFDGTCFEIAQSELQEGRRSFLTRNPDDRRRLEELLAASRELVRLDFCRHPADRLALLAPSGFLQPQVFSALETIDRLVRDIDGVA